MLRKTILLLLLCVMLVSCGSNKNEVPTNSAPSEVVRAAENGLVGFRESIAVGNEIQLGFSSRDQFASAQLGAPYHSFYLTSPGQTSQTIYPINEWEFPVMVDGDSKCILTVSEVNDQWQAVSIGANMLAAWLQITEKSLRSSNLTNKGLVKSLNPDIDMLVVNPSDIERASFLLLPAPWAGDMIRLLPQYSGWHSSDPVPELSFDETRLMLALYLAQTH